MGEQTKKLKGIVPDNVIKELDAVLSGRSISNTQLAAFLGQTGHESGGFKKTTENLNYKADRLLQIFGKKFAGVAKDYAGKPEKIANRAYASKGGNGNEASGDGWKYRGRGYIQLTLKNNYVSFGASIHVDVVKNPDLVSTKYPLESAIWYFDTNKLWVLAGDANKFSDLTGKINTAKDGLKNRTLLFNQYLKALG